MAIFFSVSYRTAEYWWEGANAPQAASVALAAATFPQSFHAIVLADVA